MRRSLHAISFVLALWAVPAFAQVEGDFSLGGGIRIGDSTTTCNAAAEGAILYDSSATKVLQFCNGTAWQNVGGGTPAGADREIQFNSAGVFGSTTTFKLMADGDLLLSGTYTGTASVPASGAGTRVFFDTQKAALRAGGVNNTQWDNASIGNYSVAIGNNATASGQFSVALGTGVTASNWGAVALGDTTTASGNQSTAAGERSTASGSGSVAMGADVSATNNQSVALGNEVDSTGQQSFGFGLTTGNATDPVVSGNQSLGVFMGNQNAVNFTAANTMGLFGGKMVIDSTAPATNLSADTELEIDGTLKISSGGEACDAAREGSIQYLAASDTFEVCKTAGSWTNMQGGTPAGANTQIQFNSGGAFGANTNFVFINSTGRLGLGLTSPGAALDISAPSTNTGSDFIALQVTGAQSTANTSGYYAAKFAPTYTASSGNTLAEFYGANARPEATGSGAVTDFFGLYSIPLNSGTGAVANMYGASVQPWNASSGTVGNMYGVYAEPTKQGTGAITSIYGLYSRCRNQNATGAVTNCYGLYLDTPVTTGAITNQYGIYQMGGNVINYFQGRVGVGNTNPYGDARMQIYQDYTTAPWKVGLDVNVSMSGSAAGPYDGVAGISATATDSQSGATYHEALAIQALGRTANDGIAQNAVGLQGLTRTYPGDTGYAISAADDDASTGGTQYGLYINMNDTDVTRWGIYQQSVNNNYFAGNVGIGDSTPDHKLDVDGNIGMTAGGYLNFGDTTGTSGYGIRDNAGTIEIKNSGGSWAAPGGGLTISVQTITASGTYTAPSGLLYAIVELCGGGGGGGGGAGNGGGPAGGGGGAGGYSREVLTAATIGASQTVTIGAAGAAGTATGGNGGNGGSTCFGGSASCGGTPLLSATGGSGGIGEDNTNPDLGARGGFGGVGSSGNINTGGADGGPGFGGAGDGQSGQTGGGGSGGSGFFGGGGGGGKSATGEPASGYCSGGGGGHGANSTNRAGGAGTAGVIFVTEYRN